MKNNINQNISPLGLTITLLEPLIKATRAGKNIAALLLEDDLVKVVYNNGDYAHVPISTEDELQAVIDVCEALQ